MRRGECAALLWDDVDECQVTIRASLSVTKAGVDRKGTKTERIRTVPLASPAVDALRRQRVSQTADRLRAGPAYNATGYVFTDEIGRRLNPRQVSTAFRRLALRAGIKRHRCTACATPAGRRSSPKGSIPFPPLVSWATARRRRRSTYTRTWSSLRRSRRSPRSGTISAAARTFADGVFAAWPPDGHQIALYVRKTAWLQWDDRDSNPDALAGCRFSHRFGFRRRRDDVATFVVRTVPWPCRPCHY